MRPLDGVRVVDWSTGTAGPRATGMLADYGADVVWIEAPGGDRFREDLAVPYSVFNRGKRSVTLDLKDRAGQEALDDLLGSADVFVQSWRPGVADRLGFGYESVHARHPGLVYVSVSGFGVDGPFVDTPGYEPLVHAIVGTMGEQPGERPPPIFEGVPFASAGAAYLAVLGAIAALWRRFDDGLGRHIETSLLDGALAYLGMLWGDSDVPPPPRDPGSHRLVARNFFCSDEKIIGVHTGAVGAFGRLLRLLGLDDRVSCSDTGLDMSLALTPEQRAVLDTELPAIFSTRTCDDWMKILTEADICAIPLLEPLDVLDQAQVRHNHMVVEIDDPVLGLVEQVGPGLRFSGFPGSGLGAAPAAGSTTLEALQNDWRAPSALRARTDSADRREQAGGLLAGLKIVDFGAFFAGPYGSRLLADLGADVIRVETLLGDPNRGDADKGFDIIFSNSHAGIRSIALDLKTAEGRDVAAALIVWADLVHHSMRPGAAERIGVGYEQARAINPTVVYGYAPGWGSTGPWANRQSFAPLMSGFVGAASEAAGQFNPPVYPTGNEDPGNGLLGAVGMLIGALHHRRADEGLFFEHPQLNAAMAHVAHIVRGSGGQVLGGLRLDPLQMGSGPLERLYEADGGWVCLVATTDTEIGALASVLGVDILGDDRFATSAGRRDHAYELELLIGSAIEGRPAHALLAELIAARVPAAAPVPYNCQTFLRDPENIRSGRSAEFTHPVRGKVRQVGVLMRWSAADRVPTRPAPKLGEHTEEILEMVGRSAADIAKLRDVGTIR